MKKFKLIKNYPGFEMPLEAIETDKGNYDVKYHATYPAEYIEKNPEFWQEVKEPLFVTDDGVAIYDQEAILTVVYKNFFEINSYQCRAEEINPGSITGKVFSSKESAEKWIEENRPKFSEKQIKDAIDKVTNPFCNINMAVFLFKLYKELGIE